MPTGAGAYETDPYALPTTDPLLRWAAQHPGSGSRAFVRGAAVAVAAPALSLRDRLAVAGPARDAVPLVREVLAEVGPAYRPLGDRALIRAVLAAAPELRPMADFGWMHTDRSPGPGADSGTVPGPTAGWLAAGDGGEIAGLLDEAFPRSYAYPGRPGARDRWAGVRRDGRLAAVAALAWCAPRVAFMAGVATAPHARGHGLGRTVCGYVLREALAGWPQAALIVDDANAAAVRLYSSLGLTHRPLAAAARRP